MIQLVADIKQFDGY